jgi:hypothetical protein
MKDKCSVCSCRHTAAISLYIMHRQFLSMGLILLLSDKESVRFEHLTAVIIKIMVFRYGAPCSVPTFGRNVMLPSLRSENGGSMFLQNFGTFSS